MTHAYASMLTVLALAAASAAQAQTSAATYALGTYQRPYAARSPWNSRPYSPTFGTFVIPPSLYYPAVAEGAYSTGVFKAASTDLPVTIVGTLGTAGVWDADSEAFKASITLPRWPATVIPATGSDGHADVIDTITGVVHSFWNLRNDNGTWRATQYAWAPLAGTGWGDPAHYFQGARAAAVPPSAGLIRKHEVNDGDTLYRHALALSLTYNGLAASPAYTYPATSADTGAAQNTGQIPEGALLMLPPSFASASITTPALRKVVETLKTYGAYVVDRNFGTPFYIYIENGAGLNLHQGGWNSVAAAELDLIRKSLRQAQAATWIDGNGVAYTPNKNLNLLSMRGTWLRTAGTRAVAFDSWKQALVCANSTAATSTVNYTNRAITRTNWSAPTVGKQYKFSPITTGGGRLRLDIINTATKAVVYSTGYVAHGASVLFTWPVASYTTALYATCGTGAATVSGTLVRMN